MRTLRLEYLRSKCLFKFLNILFAFIILLLCEYILYHISYNIENNYNISDTQKSPERLFLQVDDDIFTTVKPKIILHPRINDTKIDWNNYTFYNEEQSRVGFDENGYPSIIRELHAKRRNFTLFMEYGFDAVLSDEISVNRPIIDVRPPKCFDIKYYSHLPKVSVVIVFSNTLLSALLRAVHSVQNRSPKELLHEIILVDSSSTSHSLKTELETYVKKNFKTLVSIIRTTKKSEIACRNLGAQNATGKIIVFLESEIEVGYNWLPPLLHPIEDDYQTITSPLIDIIDGSSFEYRGTKKIGRGAFDWEFNYKIIPVLPENKKYPEMTFASPIFTSSMFAISATFFDELQGYDVVLNNKGGEIFEMSFKTWLCGGEIINIPCSRVGKILKIASSKGNVHNENLKLIAEIWMDDYKEKIYKQDPDRWKHVFSIPSVKQFEFRAQCLPFSHFIETVAFDMNLYAPLLESPNYAYGNIRNIKHDLCLDSLDNSIPNHIGVSKCVQRTDKKSTQYWEFTWYKDIRSSSTHCLEITSGHRSAPVWKMQCHTNKIGQGWIYDRENKLMINEAFLRRCLTIDPIDQKVFVDRCNLGDVNMQWEWTFIDEEAMDEFFENEDYLQRDDK